jgi:protein-L-isoaspartate(D-aspartate) O-methyltransferase
MIDFAAARSNMVEGQVRTQDVTNRRLTGALFEIPRERFLPPNKTALAYLDYDIPLGDEPTSRRLIKPMVLSKLIQEAAPQPTDRVLDIACGTGYSSALWAKLAGAVTALEDDPALARQAQKNLGSAVTVAVGPLTAGWAKGAPYDIILINGACESAPKSLFAQLNDGGRLLCVLGARPGKATSFLRTGDDISARPLFDAAAPLLPDFAKTPAFVF